MAIEVPPFCIQIANTQALKQRVYQLRYQVYCLESDYEDPDKYPEKLEYDEFDPQALHVLVTDTRNDANVGTIRLIFASEADQPFQYEQLSGQCFEHIHDKPRSHYAEMSRLAVAKAYRNSGQTDSMFPEDDSSLLGTMLIYAACLAITDLLEIEIVALLEERFAGFLGRAGVSAAQIGEPISLGGLRAPYVLDIKRTMDTHKDKFGQLYMGIEQALATDIRNHPAAALANTNMAA